MPEQKMLEPPFRPAASPIAAATGPKFVATPESAEQSEDPEACTGGAMQGRVRLAHLAAHLLCSLIGTCLSTAELRKLMARFIVVDGLSDLDVHHEAVRLAAEGGAVAKTLNKALDRRHEAVLGRFSRARDAGVLAKLWDEAYRSGEIPGAYWAVLSHRDLTPELRQRVFGEVHMLSHMVGAANRADLRRLVALQREKEDLRERLEEQGMHSRALAARHDQEIDRLQLELAELRMQLAKVLQNRPADRLEQARTGHEPGIALVALHTERRERAEQATAVAEAEAVRAKKSLEQMQQHAAELQRELVAAERQLREVAGQESAPQRILDKDLRGRRVLYVGGRPSSTPAIRELVLRHGGEFKHHDGGLEDRKGLLASAVMWAELVVFPVDGIDHDSAGNLKRLCARHDLPFLALRNASVASLAAALSNRFDPRPREDSSCQPRCLRHG
jgi:hypothetical protein